MIAEGRASAALTALENELKTYTGFRDVPGSWWDQLVPLQIQALLALKKEKEAADAAAMFAQMASSDENKRISKAFVAVVRTRKGEHQSSLPLYDEAYKATKRQDILGLIAVNKGDSLVALGDALKAKGEIDQADRRYEAALLSYLRVPALYPSQKQYLPQATLGAGRAYLGMEDFERALVSVKELRENFAGTPEAEAATDLETRVKKRREQLADPKTAATAKPAS
jgi:tetratricopeptide (TPR) repeat protein